MNFYTSKILLVDIFIGVVLAEQTSGTQMYKIVNNNKNSEDYACPACPKCASLNFRCLDGYHFSNGLGKCVINLKYGDACTNRMDECYQLDINGKNTLRCEQTRCQCRDQDHHFVNGQCSNVSARMVVSTIFASFMLYVSVLALR